MNHSLKKHALIFSITTVLLCLIADTSTVFSNTFSRTKKTLVLDPGHGDHDKGANGPDHSFEKDITLSIAKKIKLQLKDKYNVILTRTDDYWIGIHNRTEIANQNNAELFISIHASGSFVHETSGINIIYFNSPTSDRLVTPIKDKNNPGLFSNSTNTSDWFNIQKKYLPASRALAKSLFKKFSQNPGHPAPRVSGIPALVLSGANMPAVIIEVGYLTNPSDEKILNDSIYIADFSNEICLGIDDFFDKYSKLH